MTNQADNWYTLRGFERISAGEMGLHHNPAEQQIHLLAQPWLPALHNWQHNIRDRNQKVKKNVGISYMTPEDHGLEF